MPIIPWRPFWDIERWFEEEWEPEEWFEREWFGPRWGLRRWLEKVPMIRTPRMDIYETDDKVVAEVELPGVDPKNIDVEVKDNVLKVEAKAQEKKEVKEKGYYRKEMGARYFKRQVTLPTEVMEEKAEAEYSDGVLKVTIPKEKPKKVEEKKIKIKVKGTKTA
jgi:HSP20 family protein